MSISRPTTPLRRLSRGSLSALSQSRGASQTTPLSFLEGALGNFSDETSILASNLQDLSSIHDALNTFNEGFGMFLYGLKAAAYCIEWSEAPQEENFQRAKERDAWSHDPKMQSAGPRASVSNIPVYAGGGGAAPGSPYSQHQSTIADQTYMTQEEDHSFEPAPPPSKAPLKSAMKKSTAGSSSNAGGAGARSASSAAGSAGAKTTAAGAKPRITLAQKKKREKYAEEIIETLPLEYRGGDVNARRLATSVIMALIAAGPAGARIADIVRAPDLPQAKVNKCLITLSNAKHVSKTSNNGIVYSLDPSRHSSLP